ncbi:MAG: hypothetical protein EOM59_00775 [Clostridia bacterium]|nr:hypothetical protein [Clostridia bacterium]
MPMNVYRFEVRHLARPFVIWLFCLVGIFVLLEKSIYPAMVEAKPQMETIFANIPLPLREAIGIDIGSFFSYEGFFAFAFTYIGILVAIMAVSLSLQVFAREKRGKCTDFLLTKPISRREAFISKYLACFSAIVAFNVVFVSVVAPNFIRESEEFSLNGRFVLYMASPFLTQIVFLSLGIFFAVFAKRVRSISGLASAFGFAAFVLSSLVDALGKDILNMLSPLNYFSPDYIFHSGGYDLKLVFAATIVLIGFLIAAYSRYSNHDITAV